MDCMCIVSTVKAAQELHTAFSILLTSNKVNSSFSIKINNPNFTSCLPFVINRDSMSHYTANMLLSFGQYVRSIVLVVSRFNGKIYRRVASKREKFAHKQPLDALDFAIKFVLTKEILLSRDDIRSRGT